jgi:hypothetical protein
VRQSLASAIITIAASASGNYACGYDTSHYDNFGPPLPTWDDFDACDISLWVAQREARLKLERAAADRARFEIDRRAARRARAPMGTQRKAQLQPRAMALGC